MVKIADCQPNGQTALVVNPSTTRIYGAFHYNDAIVISDPNTIVVYVDEPLSVVVNWLKLGVFYKNNAIYRRFNIEPVRVVAFVNETVEFKITLPEKNSETINIRIVNTIGITVDETEITVNDLEQVVQLTAPNNPGVYNVKFESEQYGRMSAVIFVQEIVKAEENKEIYIEKPNMSIEGITNLSNNELNKVLTENLNDKTLNDKILQIKQQLDELSKEKTELEKRNIFSIILEKLQSVFKK